LNRTRKPFAVSFVVIVPKRVKGVERMEREQWPRRGAPVL
jgi:hypothetical protein